MCYEVSQEWQRLFSGRTQVRLPPQFGQTGPRLSKHPFHWDKGFFGQKIFDFCNQLTLL